MRVQVRQVWRSVCVCVRLMRVGSLGSPRLTEDLSLFASGRMGVYAGVNVQRSDFARCAVRAGVEPLTIEGRQARIWLALNFWFRLACQRLGGTYASSGMSMGTAHVLGLPGRPMNLNFVRVAIVLAFVAFGTARAETIPATDTGAKQLVWTMGVPWRHDGVIETVRTPDEPFGSYGVVLNEWCRRLGFPKETRCPGTAESNDQPFNAANCNMASGAFQVNPPATANATCQGRCEGNSQYWYAIGGAGTCSPNNYGPGQYGSAALVYTRPVYVCPTGQNWKLTWATCVRPDCRADQVRNVSTGVCLIKPEAKEHGPAPEDLCVGNPINAGTGGKYQFQEIYTGTPSRNLNYSISYVSRTGTDTSSPKFSHGPYWQSSFDIQLQFLFEETDTSTTGPALVAARRASGKLLQFSRQMDGTYLPDNDVSEKLIHIFDQDGVSDRWILLNFQTNTVEEYFPEEKYGSVFAGKFRSLSTLSSSYQSSLIPDVFSPPNGFTYGTRVTGGYPKRLTIGYDVQGRVNAVTDPSGGVIQFSYDGVSRLTSITWQDGATRTFLYEDVRFVGNLTGIIDENGARFATWAYDSLGRATSSEHAGGAERVMLDYGISSTTVTDSLGAAQVKNLTPVLGVTRSSGSSQPGGSGCGPSSSGLSYDSRGNVSSRDDFNGHRVCYAYDPARNVESVRVEGLSSTTACSAVTAVNSTLPLGSRKVSQQWHPNWHLKTKLAEPGKLTTYVYNGQPDPFAGGQIASCAPTTAILSLFDLSPIVVLCKVVEQASSDTDGKNGFGAALTAGVANRQFSWTYGEDGQVLTATDPRGNTSTYGYHQGTTADSISGDLRSATNAAGHVTQYTRYDMVGRLLTSVAPSGTKTDTTYTPRGWVSTVTITPTGGAAAQVTSYGYDLVGQLKTATLQDGTVTTFTYDNAHRLTGIADGAGNTLTYGLDSAGNRISEQRKDPLGALTRTIGRVFDGLGRLQSVTGAAQ